MTGLLLFLNFFNIIFFRKNWKKLFYLLIFFLPYLGYIQLQISQYTVLSPLIHDIIFIVPLFIFFIIDRKKIDFFPQDLKKIIIFFIIILIIQFLNPFNNIGILGRLVGFKVWFFYFFFILVGYHLISNNNDLKKFCNIFSKFAIVPFIIGSLIYISYYLFGFQQTMTFFYGDFSIASKATQNFAKFDYGSFSYFRNPSTFSYSAQYLNYCLIVLITSFTSYFLSKTTKEKNFYKLLIIFTLISAFLTGNRGSIVYISIFLIIFFFQKYQLKDIKFAFVKIILIFLFLIFIYNNIPMIKEIVSLGQLYTTNTFFSNFSENILNYFLGSGLGNSTSGVRYLEGNKLNMINEGLYWKVIVELGFFGLIVFLSLFLNYLKQIKIVKKKLSTYNEINFCYCFYAFILFQIIAGFKSWVYFEGYPSNFIFFLLLGIIIKLGTDDYIKNSYR